MYRIVFALTTLSWLSVGSLSAELPRPVFYGSFDHGLDADVSSGDPVATVMALDAILYEAAMPADCRKAALVEDGIVGRARRFDKGCAFEASGNIHPKHGTIMTWVRPAWAGQKKSPYATLFDWKNWGRVYKYTDSVGLTFSFTAPQTKQGVDWSLGASIAHWKPGQWHHVACTYDVEGAKERKLYLDGKPVGSRQIESPEEWGRFFFIGCNLDSRATVRADFDEFAIFKSSLSDAQIAEAYARGRRGAPLLTDAKGSNAAAGREPPAPSPRPELPAWVNWKLPDGPPIRTWRRADRRGGRVATATRERVSLNGIWRFRPVGAEKWHYLRVPGAWNKTSGVSIRDAAGKTVRKIEDIPPHHLRAAWYERQFDLPDGWEKAKVMLGLDSVRSIGEVFVNGRHVGRALEYQRNEWDVSKALRPGNNLLQIRVETLYRTKPNHWVELCGLDEDVWLERRPAGPTLDWVDLHPRVVDRRMEAVARARGELDGVELIVRVTDLEGAPICQGRGKAEEGGFTIVWQTPSLKPWHPDRPQLYLAQAALEKNGRVIDQLYPVRFGYRQFEICGGDFFLNGRKFHVRGQASPPSGFYEFNAVESHIRAWYAMLKKMHVNAVREHAGAWLPMWGSQWRALYYDVADEMGMMIFPLVPSNRLFFASYPREERDFEDPRVAAFYRQRVADFVHRWGNHACATMWDLNFNFLGYSSNLRPDLIDGSFEITEHPRGPSFTAWQHFSEEAVNTADGSRPVFHHAGGVNGQVVTLNCYLGFGIPLQEREDYPIAWAKTRFKPLLPIEAGFPLLLSNYRLRLGPLSEVYASEQLTPEYFAAYVGDQVYEDLTEEEVRALNPSPEVSTWERRDAMRRTVNYDRQKALFARRTLRSWRTYGISGYCQHAEWQDCYTRPQRTLPNPQRDPRDFGLQYESEQVRISGWGNLTRMGETARVDNAPLLAYVAGPRRRLTAKEHSFYSGESIEKSVVLINDSPDPVAFSGRLVARLADKTCHEQTIEADVEVGGIHFVPVRFVAPQVAERTEGRIVLEINADGKQLGKDCFAWQCWPRSTHPELTGKVALIDTVGKTTAALKRAEVSVSDQLEPDTRLLIVGRGALDDATRERLDRENVMRRIAAGLNVLVFEQTGEQLAGMPMDDPNCRAAFVRAPDHPLLAALGNEDLRHWRGQSDVTWPPFPKYQRENLDWPEEFVRWGNQGVVCSFAPQKPQRGNFAVLVDADYDLFMAPLVEWRHGRGRIVFCQLDVTSRYGADPVPTLLVNRLLEYLDGPPASVPAATGAVLRGGAKTKVLAEALSVEADAEGSVMIVGPDWNGDPEELAAFARRGGRVVIVGNARAESAALFAGAKIVQRDVFKVGVPDALARRGVAPGDFYWREIRNVPVLDSAPGKTICTKPAIVAVRPLGKGEIVWCGVTPAEFDDVRAKAKTTRLLSALVGRGAALPDLSADKPAVGKPGSPHATENLGFNPYRYRHW